MSSLVRDNVSHGWTYLHSEFLSQWGRRQTHHLLCFQLEGKETLTESSSDQQEKTQQYSRGWSNNAHISYSSSKGLQHGLTPSGSYNSFNSTAYSPQRSPAPADIIWPTQLLSSTASVQRILCPLVWPFWHSRSSLFSSPVWKRLCPALCFTAELWGR